MFVKNLGKFEFRENNILFLDDKRHKAYEFKGENVLPIIKELIPFCTGTISIQNIHLNLNKRMNTHISFEDILNIIEELRSIGALSTDEDENKFGFLTNLLPSYSLDNNLVNKFEVKDVSKLINLSHDDIKKFRLIIAIDYESNSKFFIQVDQLCAKYKIPWLRVSIAEPFFYIGPMFFHDSGPCFNCLNNRIRFNKGEGYPEVQAISSIGLIENSIYPYILKEILNFIRDDRPLNTFEREIIINFENFDISKYLVLSIPQCSTCSRKGVNKI